MNLFHFVPHNFVFTKLVVHRLLLPYWLFTYWYFSICSSQVAVTPLVVHKKPSPSTPLVVSTILLSQTYFSGAADRVRRGLHPTGRIE